MELKVTVEKQQGPFRCVLDFTACGDRIGVFGPSGSGKSTLMHMLAGLSHPDQGRIALDGRLLYDHTRHINLPPEQRRIGVVFQHSHLFPHMSVRANLLYGFRRTPLAERHIDPAEIIEVLHLEHLLDRGVGLLSGGERQRVALARTVLCCPKLILMDEPLSGLDESLKFEIIPYLNRVCTEYAIPFIFISHSLIEMRLMTKEVLVLDAGRLNQQLGIEELAQEAWSTAKQGYTNLLHLGRPRESNDLFVYPWGRRELILCEGNGGSEYIFELDAREILLFKKHPEATSARNMLDCTVRRIFTAGNRVRVEMECGGQTLIAQIVPEAVRELDVTVGSRVVAVIKASAFHRLC
jgi:molybdate transport system ATP-binding protein